MDLTLMELAATNAALLAYRDQLRILAKDPALTRAERIDAKVHLRVAESALVKVQKQMREQSGTYR